MNLYKIESPYDRVLQEDLEWIAGQTLPYEEMRGAYIMVTGATGLVGSMAVKALACCNRILDLGMKILPLIRSEEKAARVFGELLEREDICPVVGDITAPVKTEYPVDYIVHGASVTASKVMVTQPVETIRTALVGTEHMLQLAAEKQVRSMVYISSMEAFGVTDPSLPCVREENLGYIDVMNVRSCYSEGKRMCEVMCASYASEYQVPVKVARLAQTFGAGVSKEEGRVFAQFARSAMTGTDIVLHTRGESTGNYCYTADAVAGILTILLKGQTGNVYTVANPSTTIKIRDMAKMVAEQLAEGRIQVVFDIPEDAMTYGYAPDVAMHLNSDKLQALGWKPKYDLPEMYDRLVKSFREQGFEA